MRPKIALLLLFLSASSTIADGGTLRLTREQAGLRLSVFTSPTPLRAGDVDVSVLVQDAKTGKVLLNQPIQVEARSLNDPIFLESTATHDLATNKLLHAAHLALPRPGRWQLLVRVADTEVDVEVELATAPPSWWGVIPWIVWPFAVIALFVLRQARRGREPDGTRSCATRPSARICTDQTEDLLNPLL